MKTTSMIAIESLSVLLRLVRELKPSSRRRRRIKSVQNAWEMPSSSNVSGTGGAKRLAAGEALPEELVSRRVPPVPRLLRLLENVLILVKIGRVRGKVYARFERMGRQH